MAENCIHIFTDGSARGNPGPGGYGIVLKYKGAYKELSEGFRMTTNNRMELLAVIVALKSLKTTNIPVRIFSDSKYVIDSIQKNWIHGWVKTGFKGKKNKDLWMEYLAVSRPLNIELIWVKGHNGHPENERCDTLAVEAALGKNLRIDTVFEELKENSELH